MRTGIFLRDVSLFKKFGSEAFFPERDWCVLMDVRCVLMDVRCVLMDVRCVLMDVRCVVLVFV